MKYKPEIKRIIMLAIRESLPPKGRKGGFTKRDGEVRKWFLLKLEGVAAFGIHAKNSDEKTLVQWVYVDMIPIKTISKALHIPERTLYHKMHRYLEDTADTMPLQMVARLLELKHARYRFNSCPKCIKSERDGKIIRGDMEFDPEGVPDYVCFQCGMRVSILLTEEVCNRKLQ
uniref:Uncharacterized protein n=1 Tax=viral metagenome TaxID=1070528 RepID=A0A6M3LB26_9ZZZZ